MNTEPIYQVLARKYRPASFADLIGQEAMVQTLKNAFDADRIAHAFIMTGVRGVGKTTTARIIATGLNCTGPDGKGGPTTEPCLQCEHCQSIAQGRHVDVLEMDAASRTGVDDVREIIDSVAYRAASARYKVYIIDEVHMLSTNAFNALLKTLEEPPEHVKFIFATTEIRKVPVTVLSRCQRFDLRRIEPEMMLTYLDGIAKKEKAEIEPEALSLITRAAEGSVRDALSLMDQAISHGAGQTNADQVRAMLGLADRGRVLDLFDFIMKGEAVAALDELSTQYAAGADPLAVLRDLAEISHWISMVKLSPEAADDQTIAPEERLRGTELAEKLPMRALTRMWQMLLKALDEVANAPNAMMAAEMAVIRLTHIADLPPPGDLVRELLAHKGGSQAAAPQNSGQNSAQNTGQNTGDGAAPTASISHQEPPQSTPQAALSGANTSTNGSVVQIGLQPAMTARLQRFEDVLALVRATRDMKLLVELETYVRPLSFAPGHIEFTPAEDAPAQLAQDLAAFLKAATGERWIIAIAEGSDAKTVAEKRANQAQNALELAQAHPLVQSVLTIFPGAEIKSVKLPESFENNDQELGLDEDDWDPFEED